MRITETPVGVVVALYINGILAAHGEPWSGQVGQRAIHQFKGVSGPRDAVDAR